MTKNQYDEIANEYAEIGPKEPIKTYVLIPSLKKIVGNIDGKRVLDLGCGNGLYARILKSLGAKEVIGVDSSKEMVKLAKEEENKKPLGIKYLVQDIRNLKSLRDFDVAVAGLVLHYARTKDELKKECDCIYESLKYGGRLIAIIGKMLSLIIVRNMDLR